MTEEEQRLEDLYNKAVEYYLDNTDHDRIISMLDEEEYNEYYKLYDKIHLGEDEK